MDEYDLVLDIIGHPDKYLPEEIEKLLSDPGIKETYEIVSLTSSAANADATLDTKVIEREWKRLEIKMEADGSRLADRHPVSGRQYRRILGLFRSRAAAITAVALTSFMAVAVGVGMKYGFDNGADEETGTVTAGEQALSTDAVSIHSSDGIVSDTAFVAPENVIFENEALGDILARISAGYGVDVDIANPEKGRLRLYFKWNPSQPIEKVVAQLDNFEQIKISFDGETIRVK